MGPYKRQRELERKPGCRGLDLVLVRLRVQYNSFARRYLAHFPMSSGIVGGNSIGRFIARIGGEADVGLDWDGVDQIAERRKVLSSRSGQDFLPVNYRIMVDFVFNRSNELHYHGG
jgi:hypothetical protein